MSGQIKTSLRPDYYEWFPTFSVQEITERLKYMSFEEATLLTPKNIKLAIAVDIRSEERLEGFLAKSFNHQRECLTMILSRVGISPKTCEAIGTVRREMFAPKILRRFSYLNMFLPWDDKSGVSPPGTVALMIDAFSEASGDIIEVGVGSGYHACCLAERSKGVVQICGFETNKSFADFGRDSIKRAGFQESVEVRTEQFCFDSNIKPGVGGIYFTAAGDMQGVTQFIRPGGIVQRVLPISYSEYKSEPASSWIRRKWPSYSDYLSSWTSAYGRITTEKIASKGLRCIDKIFDVSFVPLVSK